MLPFIDCIYILVLALFNLVFVILCYKTYFRWLLFCSLDLFKPTNSKKNTENPYLLYSLLLSTFSYYFLPFPALYFFFLLYNISFMFFLARCFFNFSSRYEPKNIQLWKQKKLIRFYQDIHF